MISSFHNKDEVRVDKFDTLLLPDVCKYTEIRTLLKPCSQNWSVDQLFRQLLKRSFLYVLLLERKYFGRARDDVIRLNFQ
jgi:hypothetical protein